MRTIKACGHGGDRNLQLGQIMSCMSSLLQSDTRKLWVEVQLDFSTESTNTIIYRNFKLNINSMQYVNIFYHLHKAQTQYQRGKARRSVPAQALCHNQVIINNNV